MAKGRKYQAPEFRNGSGRRAVQMVQELRRSGSAGFHADTRFGRERTRGAAKMAAAGRSVRGE